MTAKIKDKHPITGIETEIDEGELFKDLKSLRMSDPIEVLIGILLNQDMSPEDMDEIIERFKVWPNKK
jgi:hypothetical protein